jgi:predicted RNA methylase
MTRTRIEHHRPQYLDEHGHFRKAYHLEMIADHARTEAIRKAIQQVIRPDTVFCELGCGSGLFSLFAAGWCRKVYAIESDPNMLEVARANVMRSRWAGKVEVIEGDATKITLPEPIDVVFAELMSIWAVEEPQVVAINHARRALLKPGGIALPTRIVNLAELGYQAFRYDEAELEAEMPLFTGIVRPAVLTERRRCMELNFADVVAPDLTADVRFEALASGAINCAVLHSIVQMGPEVVFSGTDSLMPPTVVPLKQELRVRAGDQIRFRAIARAWSELGESMFVAEVE